MLQAQVPPAAVEISTSWSVLISFVALGFTIYQTVIRRDEKRDEMVKNVTSLTEKVNVIWHLIFPASVSAALRGGILERHSPLSWAPHALMNLEGLTSKVKEWYLSEGHLLKDLPLLVKISEVFGPDIAAFVVEEKPRGFGFEAIVMSLFCLVRPDSELLAPFNEDRWQEKT